MVSRLSNKAMITRKSSEKGFTLIDLAIYSGLLGILLVILSELFISIVQLQLSSGAQGAVEQNGAYILSRTTYDLRRATLVTLPVLGGTTATLSASIADGGIEVPYRYELENQNLILTVGSETTQLNSSDTEVADFLVTKVGNSGQIATARDTIVIGFTVRSKGVTSAGQKERQYRTTVSLR